MKKYSSTKKITANLPLDLLRRSQAFLHKGITETIIIGLEEVVRRHQLKALAHLKGKISFDLDLKKTRQ